MDAKEHAEIWRKAARVVAALDPRTSWQLPQDQNYGFVGPSYSQAQSAAWDGYSAAAQVLRAIADEYEKAAKPSSTP